MLLFAPSLPLSKGPHVTKAHAFQRLATHSPRPACNSCTKPSIFAVFSGNTGHHESQNQSPSWQDEIRLLLDPTLNLGAKQVLAQDLAKRAPEIFGDACAGRGFGVSGIADVMRQIQEDVLPDLVSNAPRYVSKAVEEFPRAVSRLSDMDTMPPMPRDAAEVQREFRNIFNRTPEGLFTPEFRVLSKEDGYEIRQYPSLIVAKVDMRAEEGTLDATELESMAAMGQSFNALARYLFGKNQEKKSMSMTTPVIMNKGQPEESMSFIIGEYETVDDVPKTLDDSIILREEPGGVYAVSEFSGFVTQGEAKRQREKLQSMLSREGIDITEQGKQSYKCMVYNGPSTLPNLRRNELFIEIIYNPKTTSSDTAKNDEATTNDV